MKLQSSICAGIDECLTYGMFLKENIDIVNQTSISAGFGAFESVMMRVLKGAVLNYIPSTGSETESPSTRPTYHKTGYKLHPQYGVGNVNLS